MAKKVTPVTDICTSSNIPAIVSFDEMRPADEWLWAGPGWRDRKARHVASISAVEIQAADPESLADRWSKAFGCAAPLAGNYFSMPLDAGEVRFIEAVDGRGETVGGRHNVFWRETRVAHVMPCFIVVPVGTGTVPVPYRYRTVGTGTGT